MTPENWPEPRIRLTWDSANRVWCEASAAEIEQNPEVENLVAYTATQIREIVRMEVEAIAKLVKSEWLTEADREYGERLAALIRAKIKEAS